MKKRYAAALAVLAALGLIVGFLMAGFSVDIYDFKPLPQQISLGLDLTGGAYAVLQADSTGMDADEFGAKLNTTLGVLRKRLDEKGFLEATVVKEGSDRIRIEVPINETSQIKDPDAILSFITQGGFLEFKNAAGETKLTGANVTQAYVSMNERNQYVTALKFDKEGAELFGKLTEDAYNNGTNIVMTLDGKTISSASVKNGAIYGGSAIIEGGGTNGFTRDEAENLAIQIQSGALPLTLHEIENRSMSASLGQDALQKSLFAGLIGIIMLFLFMFIYYRLPGVVACIALTLYIFLILLVLALIKSIQLTLPGIAGIILGVGMAVDANVLIFERFKEEFANGKTLRASMNSGFHKAMSTIIDSNLTTVIAGAVIAFFGVGTVKGFGFTLIISIVISMFTAITVTRWLLNLVLDMNVKNVKFYTIRKSKAQLAAEKEGGLA